MIPWPIALLSLFYGMLMAVSATSVWQVLTGVVHKPLTFQVVWLILSGAAMLGLPLRQVWGRWFAILSAWLVTVSILAIAAWLILAGSPGWGLAAGFGTVVPLVAIRYLRRPAVKAYFETHPTYGI